MLKARLGTDFDRVVHRILPFVRRIPLSPDSMTLIGVAFSALAAVAFAGEHFVYAGLLMLVAGFCDLCDGVVARAQGTSSRAGAFFDSSMDRVSDLLIFGGIATAFAARAEVGSVILVLWALAASVMTSYVRARAEVEIESLSVGLIERGERFIILLLGAFTGFMVAALWLVAVGATITTLQRLVVARREIAKREGHGSEAEQRELATADPSPVEEAS